MKSRATLPGITNAYSRAIRPSGVLTPMIYD